MVIPSDPWHLPASRILDGIHAGLYRHVSTTDYVLVECWNFIQARRGRPSAVEALHELAFGSEDRPALLGTIHRVHSGRFAAALQRYRREFSRGLSLTDWTTLVVMDEVGIDAVATFDQGFRGLAKIVDDA